MMDSAYEPRTSLITRRDLVLRCGASLAAVAGAGLFNFEDALADETKPKLILGSGSHRYECIHDWLVPPDGLLWGDTQGVAQDSKGNIYVTHTVAGASKIGDAIVVFDKRGKFLKSWGSRFRGGGHGIEIRKEGKNEYAYHCDTAHRMVVKTDLDGAVVWEKPVPQEPGVYKGNAPFVPTNIAFAPNGDFYVADGYGSNWIHHYNLKGDWIRTWGGTGTEDGKFHCCHGIWLDPRHGDPLLVVTDRESKRIQYFDLEGKFVKSVSEGIRRPCYFDTRGDLMVISDLNQVVQLLDKDDKVVQLLGDGAGMPELRGKPRSEYVPGKFIHPHGGKFLKNGDILIAEWMPDGRITLLRRV
jgi:YD repeat-containing protein